MADLSVIHNITMSSGEIAELVGSRHDNVRVSIERLADAGVIQLPAMQEVKNNQSLSPNNKSKVYVFSGEQGKRDSIIVVAQLCPEFTAKIVDRWLELEKLNKKPRSTCGMILDMAQQLYDHEQALFVQQEQLVEHDSKIKKLEKDVEILTDDETWFTAKGAALLYGYNQKTEAELSLFGKRLSTRSRELDCPIHKAPNKRYGHVNVYHIDIIKQVIETERYFD